MRFERGRIELAPGCGGGAAVELLASLLVLLSTSAPKIPLPGLESDLAARGGAL